jgi:hypothetical protein
MFTLNFWKDAAERALKTAAQAILLALGGSEVANLFTLNWTIVGQAALSGAVLSLLSSIISAPFAVKGTASLVDATLPEP